MSFNTCNQSYFFRFCSISIQVAGVLEPSKTYSNMVELNCQSWWKGRDDSHFPNNSLIREGCALADLPTPTEAEWELR